MVPGEYPDSARIIPGWSWIKSGMKQCIMYIVRLGGKDNAYAAICKEMIFEMQFRLVGTIYCIEMYNLC